MLVRRPSGRPSIAPQKFSSSNGEQLHACAAFACPIHASSVCFEPSPSDMILDEISPSIEREPQKDVAQVSMPCFPRLLTFVPVATSVMTLRVMLSSSRGSLTPILSKEYSC